MKLGELNLSEMTCFYSCWLIIEHVLPREGDQWRRLSFFLHPVSIVLVYLFIALLHLFRLQQLVIGRISNLLFCAFQIVSTAIISIFRCRRSFVFHISEIEVVSLNTCRDEREGNASEIFSELDVSQCTVTHVDCNCCPIGSKTKEQEESILHDEYSNMPRSVLLGDNLLSARYGPTPEFEENFHEPADGDDHELSPICMLETSDSLLPVFANNSLAIYEHSDEMVNHEESMVHREDDGGIYNYFSVQSSSAPSILELEQGNRKWLEIDLFYEYYDQRMRWFDQLNAERRFAVSTILNVRLGMTSLNDRFEPLDFSSSPSVHEKLAKCIKSDFEVVYVGHACLSWEALCHHYREVEELTLIKDAEKGGFPGKVSEKFQQFQVLLEWFTENEQCQRKRSWNYAHARFCNTNLLQVPEISGYVEEMRVDMKGETTKASVVLEVIEKVMWSFWLFLSCDSRKAWRILKKLRMIDCQVEDPRDLEFFTSLSKEAQKKYEMVKKLLKKSRQRKTPEEETQVEILIPMVDIYLIKRVLKMSVITSAQLKWCDEKLRSIVLEQGGFRSTNGCLLFPHS